MTMMSMMMQVIQIFPPLVVVVVFPVFLMTTAAADTMTTSLVPANLMETVRPDNALVAMAILILNWRWKKKMMTKKKLEMPSLA